MKSIIASFLCLVSLNLAAKRAHLSEPYNIEKKILVLSLKLDKETIAGSKYKNLKAFCNDNSYRQTIFGDQIHDYHNMPEEKLQTTAYDHYKAAFGTRGYHDKVYTQEVVMHRYLAQLSKRIKRIKKHVEHFYIRRRVWEP